MLMVKLVVFSQMCRKECPLTEWLGKQRVGCLDAYDTHWTHIQIHTDMHKHTHTRNTGNEPYCTAFDATGTFYSNAVWDEFGVSPARPRSLIRTHVEWFVLKQEKTPNVYKSDGVSDGALAHALRHVKCELKQLHWNGKHTFRFCLDQWFSLGSWWWWLFIYL